jgi:leucyl-tRNA synthetase
MGERKINYKLRDWLFARQRYWGEPFPVVYDDEFPDVAIPISESDLPLVLPQTDNFKPSGSGEGPLANVTEWVKTTVPGNPSRPATRETNTMPQWAGSCWYYLRFIDPTNENALIDKSLEKYWMPVDLYVGGAEHAVLHLLYARFWHKVLFDIGVVSTKEPFRKLVSQGMILGEVEYTGFVSENTGEFVSAGSKEAQNAIATKLDATKVTKKGDGYVLTENPLIKVNSRAFKMSKSRGNVINPDDVVSEYGADSLRLYEMFMGPLTDVKVWQTSGVSGCYRFLARAYRLFENEALVTNEKATEEQLRDTNKMIAKVTEATETLSFNVAIAAMMEFTNAATKWETKPRECLKPFALCLSPYAPHLSEELYAKILETTNETDYAKSNAYCEWPEADAKYLVEDTIEMGVQVNGKTRGSIKIAPDATEAVAMDLANNESSVQKMLDGKQIVKVIYKASKILNIVVK